jgi:hypothetical protein
VRRTCSRQLAAGGWQSHQFENWLAAAEKRYLADLTGPELTRALRALSSCYVERRRKLATGDAIATAGKRAAFALFYGPLHFLTIREVAREVLGARPDDGPLKGGGVPRRVVDLGSGTGAAGAAWALGSGAAVDGYDINPWAVGESGWTYRTLGLEGTAHRVSVDKVRFPKAPADILAAFVLNELPALVRDAMKSRLMAAARDGHRVLLVEPLARGAAPWWPDWERDVTAVGGHANEWRFRVELPDLVRRLDTSAGLDHRELTARTLTAGF